MCIVLFFDFGEGVCIMSPNLPFLLENPLIFSKTIDLQSEICYNK